MIKTTSFRWKFYTAEESKYEQQNAFSSGIAPVLERLRASNVIFFFWKFQYEFQHEKKFEYEFRVCQV